MKRLFPPILVFILLVCSFAKADEKNEFPAFAWMKDVGAKSFPESSKIYYVNDFGAVGDAVMDCTEAIQKTIDVCATNGGGKVSFHPGIYLSGSVFVKSNVNFEISKGTMIIGSQNLADYKKIDTRIAGIEMTWPAGLVNIIGQKNAAISGDGVINGRGKIFWDKYWMMRQEYDPKGLRWIVDYDCERPQGIIISNCKNVTVKDIVLYQPGFWSLHILYSDHITVDGVIISNNIEGRGPSTDGIDIDSSTKILVQNSNINCNDDNFCLKAGRDADGLRVNKPTEYVVIRDCVAGHGDGLFTCGSETSGGIRNVVAYNLKGVGTKYGLRFKSTVQRGGVIENIYLSDITMEGVRNPFVVNLNWNPAYSNSLLPEGYTPDSIPEYWKKMLEPVDPKEGTPKFRNIIFKNIDVKDAAVCMKVGGIESSTIDNFVFKNVHFEGKNTGSVSWAKNWTFENFSVEGTEQKKPDISNCVGVNL
ncbi:MAG: glycoside hydrolase family 28 protein [Paludibacter sp.]|nr:glycoside hydrolase family 28 protein [Paludibacter sp.]